jgi:peptidoglycan/LPS O-acetylase OafA/YrhL
MPPSEIGEASSERALGSLQDPDAPSDGEGLGYLAGVDGIRALAVIGVLLYHGGASWLPAGFLGVDAFFVLSGFLITTLLLQELRHTRTVELMAFWGRRARRLLPALLLMVAFCALFVWLVAVPGSYPHFGADSIGTIFYVANWHFIVEGANYFVATSPPSPLTHTWSLAIEEQFYVLWPLLLLGIVRLGGRTRAILWVSIVGAALSSGWMALRHQQGASLTRLYYGTDTHAQCLLVGAALAAGLALIAQRRRLAGTTPQGRSTLGLGGDPGWFAATPSARQRLTVIGIGGLVVGGLCWWRASFDGGFLYNGGFLLMALATAAVIAAAVSHQRGPVARLLSFAPLVFIGRISYGLYLWHYPLFIWLNSARTGLTGSGLLALRLGVSLVVAIASFYLVERPIRHGGVLRGWSGIAAAAASVATTAALVLGVTAASASPGPTAPGTGIVRTQPVSGTNPVRVYVTGDSMGLTLSMVMNDTPMLERYHLDVIGHGIVGCGVVRSDSFDFFGYWQPTVPECQLHPAPGQLTAFEQLRPEEARFRPDVVVVSAGRMEVGDRLIDGRPTNILQPSFQALVRQGLEQEMAIARSAGAKVLLLTMPCTDSGSQPDGSPWPSDSPKRLAIYNSIVREVAASHPADVQVFDMNALLCPGGVYHATIDGTAVRQADGIHFAVSGNSVINRKLFPVVSELGLATRIKAQVPR